jgi:polysaccharide export outer membrane protein
MLTIRSNALFTLLAVLAWVGAAVAQDHAPAAAVNVGFGSGAAGPIGAGDLVEMTILDTPELSGKLRVSNTGDVILPLVGSVHLQDMKASDAQTLIRQKYVEGSFLKDPQVTLFIAEYASRNVSVVGEVHKPGVYPAFGQHQLLDYLSLAEGLTNLAGTAIVITHSGHPDQPVAVKMMAGAAPQPENNPEIFPGDTIFVQRTGAIFVVGDVAHPGEFPMDHDGHLSILQAISLAQGTNPTAAKASAKLIRTTLQGRQEIPINLKKIVGSREIDIAMQDNDILFVPSSAAKNAWRDFELALPAAAGAAIYRAP